MVVSTAFEARSPWWSRQTPPSRIWAAESPPASGGRRRTVDGPRDMGLTPDRAAELFFRDIMASIEQGEDR